MVDDDIEPWVFSTHKHRVGTDERERTSRKQHKFDNEEEKRSERDWDGEGGEQIVVAATKRIAKATARELDNYPLKTLCSVLKFVENFKT